MAERGVKRSSSDNEFGRRQQPKSMRLNKNKEEDRLSSLPDSLLTDILSCLPIKYAAATSVLSHRWRNLWNGVTRFVFNSNHFEEENPAIIVAIVNDILGKLTSPILHVFDLQFPQLLEECESDVVQSWFRQVCCRKVQHFIFSSVMVSDTYELYRVPTVCLFQLAQSLVTLDLDCMLTFDTNVATTRFEFPYLKKLCLQGLLIRWSPWLGTLIESSPLLECLILWFEVIAEDSQFDDAIDEDHNLNIVAPSLLILVINMPRLHTQHYPEICIDAPNLIDIAINDSNSCYYFVQTPTMLTKACIDLRSRNLDEEEQGYDRHQMVKFVFEMSNVHTLDLHLGNRSNLCTHYANHGLNLPLFSKLTSFTTDLSDIGLVGCKDLLSFLHYSPNLKHLKFNMADKTPRERMVWGAPDSTPKCLTSKVETIEISNLGGNSAELQLVAYILSNATMLKQLEVSLCLISRERRQDRLWNACRFCWSLFQCPRGSPTCNISFVGGGVKASSDDFNGELTCTIQSLG